jgi:hypothetical protein
VTDTAPPAFKLPATVAEAIKALSDPFPPDVVEWRPDGKPFQRDGKTWALAVPYLDARSVQSRMDAVFGPNNWFPRYLILPGGEVECQLSARFPGSDEWIMKPDVGKPVDTTDEHGLKAAYTDGFKRAAVVFGIGRYLYTLGRAYAPYDSQGKYLTEVPELPQWAMPEEYRRAGSAMAAELDRRFGELAKLTGGDKAALTADTLRRRDILPDTPLARIERRHVRAMFREIAEAAERSPLPDRFPQSGPELARRLAAHDAELSDAKHCGPGQLVAYVVECGVKSQFPSELKEWNKNSQIRAAAGWAKEFQDRHVPAAPKKNPEKPKAAEPAPQY